MSSWNQFAEDNGVPVDGRLIEICVGTDDNWQHIGGHVAGFVQLDPLVLPTLADFHEITPLFGGYGPPVVLGPTVTAWWRYVDV